MNQHQTIDTWDYHDLAECDERIASGDGVIVVARRGTWVVTITGHEVVVFDHDDDDAARSDYEETVVILFGREISTATTAEQVA
jgi:hypothetical protein